MTNNIVSIKGNFLFVKDTAINIKNILTIKKYLKDRSLTNKYAIGVASACSANNWQFIFETNDEAERDFIFDKIINLLEVTDF